MTHFIPYAVETYGFGFASKVLSVELKMGYTHLFKYEYSTIVSNNSRIIRPKRQLQRHQLFGRYMERLC